MLSKTNITKEIIPVPPPLATPDGAMLLGRLLATHAGHNCASILHNKISSGLPSMLYLMSIFDSFLAFTLFMLAKT